VTRSGRRTGLWDREGLTLVELMVAITMFGVAVAVIFGFLTNSRRSYSNMSSRVEYQQGTRAVLTLMSGEIRSAGCDPLDMNFNTFPLADATTIQCRSDLDGDGVIETVEPAEDVTYTWDAVAQELRRDNGSGAQTVLRGVTALDLRYFDEDGAELAVRPLSADDRARVRCVQVDITGITERGEPLRYVTRVNARNG